MNLVQELSKCELFSSLTKEELEPIASLGRVENYQAGETIFRQGEQGNTIYIIKEGQVTLGRSVDLGDRTAQVTIAVLTTDRALGCWLALLEEPHNLMSSAVCNRKTEVISLEGPALRKILENNLPAGFKVMEKLAHILRDRLWGVYGAMEKL